MAATVGNNGPTSAYPCHLPPTAGTHVFKAFNTIGVEHMAHPGGELIAGERLQCLFAGPPEQQDKCAEIIEAVGLIPEYLGPIRWVQGRALG